MRARLGFLSGVAAGVGLMYFLDPDRGRRRRARLRDRLAHGAHELEDAGRWLDARSRDLRNRARGVVAEGRARLHHEQVDDPVLEARVRTALGRAVPNPHAIRVVASGGDVTLTGSVLQDDVTGLLAAVRGVRGVSTVRDELTVHDSRADVPELQTNDR